MRTAVRSSFRVFILVGLFICMCLPPSEHWPRVRSARPAVGPAQAHHRLGYERSGLPAGPAEPSRRRHPGGSSRAGTARQRRPDHPGRSREAAAPAGRSSPQHRERAMARLPRWSHGDDVEDPRRRGLAGRCTVHVRRPRLHLARDAGPGASNLPQGRVRIGRVHLRPRHPHVRRQLAQALYRGRPAVRGSRVRSGVADAKAFAGADLSGEQGRLHRPHVLERRLRRHRPVQAAGVAARQPSPARRQRPLHPWPAEDRLHRGSFHPRSHDDDR